MIEIISVYANPFTVPDPRIIRTSAARNVVICPSRIADNAFLYPSFIAA